jgi:type IV pilus assembly protein PilC
MKLYYRAVGQDGKVVRGLIEAKDIKEAAFYLRKHQMLPIVISAGNKFNPLSFLPFLKRTSSKDLIFFTRQLASMLGSGLTLMQALTIMKSQIKKPGMADVLQGLISRVQDGSSFSSALEKYTYLFSPIYVALMRAAESSGLLDKVLARLADNLEKQQRLKSTIQGALVYPIIVIIMMLGVIIIMMVVAIPQLNTFYDSMGVELPLPTVIVIEMSNILIKFWWLMIAGIFLGIVLFRRWHRKETGRMVVDSLVLKIPIVGVLISQSLVVEFSRTLGLLIGTGSLVVDSLLRSADVVDNVIYRKEIIIVAKRVEKGISMGDALEASSLFPPILVQMVKIGDQTGKLDDSLTRVAEYFEREVEQTVKALTTAMEPVIMVVLGLGVGFLILAVITPIYKVISAIQ